LTDRGGFPSESRGNPVFSAPALTISGKSEKVPYDFVRNTPGEILDPKYHPNAQPWNLSRALNRLRQAAGGIVHLDELVDAVFDCREDGGPLSARQIICDTVQTLCERGFPIERVTRGRYRYAAETIRCEYREAA
jgi:hypothetical protein